MERKGGVGRDGGRKRWRGRVGEGWGRNVGGVGGHTTGHNCLVVDELFLCNMSCFIPLHSAASSHSASSCTHSCSLARTVLLHMYMHI